MVHISAVLINLPGIWSMKKILILTFVLVPLFSTAQPGLFDSDSVINVRLRGEIRDLINDRRDEPADHVMFLSYEDNGKTVEIPVSTRTRGNFRRKLGDCIYPPVMVSFRNTEAKSGTIFHDQRKTKLVVPCRSEELLIREYLAYKIYNMVTPMSFRARLLKVTMEDTRRKKVMGPFFAFMLEEEEQVAKRNGMKDIEKRIPPFLTDLPTFLNMAMFEYMIGNTDWSVEYMHNVKLIAMDTATAPYTIPYDFDHAGIVNAPYAYPAEELRLPNVVTRRYRGYCTSDMKDFEPGISLFNRIKDSIYELYQSTPYLNAGTKKWTINYLDDFYETINTPAKLAKDFGYPCDRSGTGDVIIKGLNAN